MSHTSKQFTQLIVNYSSGSESEEEDWGDTSSTPSFLSSLPSVSSDGKIKWESVFLSNKVFGKETGMEWEVRRTCHGKTNNKGKSLIKEMGGWTSCVHIHLTDMKLSLADMPITQGQDIWAPSPLAIDGVLIGTLAVKHIRDRHTIFGSPVGKSWFHDFSIILPAIEAALTHPHKKTHQPGARAYLYETVFDTEIGHDPEGKCCFAIRVCVKYDRGYASMVSAFPVTSFVDGWSPLKL